MSIISLKFIVFVVGLLLIYYIVPKKIRWIVLLLGSLYYYYLSSGKLVLYVISSTVIIYAVGLMLGIINRTIKEIGKDYKNLKKDLLKFKRVVLIFGILLNIGILIYTKYFNFLFKQINYLLHAISIKEVSLFENIILPIGISYYTLETISYIVDVYREKYEPTKNPLKLLLYLTYFPKIIEGPICRFNEMKKEFAENNKLDFNNFFIGFDLIIWGLFKKLVIADRAGIYVNNVFGNNYGGMTVVLAIILYTFQIYAEFSGCIDIVRGVSKLFGINLPNNFKRPFFSKDIQEFWRRWHISLGAWIKDYIFYPISLSKMNMKVIMFSKKHMSDYWFKFISAAFPLLFVWLVNGLWHGASYKYIAYGLYYYFFMMIGLLLEPLFFKIRTKFKLKKVVVDIVHILRTIIIVLIGMTLFRINRLNEFIPFLLSIFKPSNGIMDFGLITIDFYILIFGFILLLIVGLLEEFNKIDLDKGFTNKIILRSVVYTILICIIVILGIYGEGYDAANFIYGAF